MPERSLGTALLALLVLLLGGLTWWSLEPATKPGDPPLTTLSPASIQRLKILNGAGTEIRLQREGGGWEMESPYALPADAAHIDKLLALAATPSHARFDEPTERLAEFGLTPPKAVVWLDDTEVRFGGPHPLEKLRFVAAGGRIHLTEERFFHLLLLPAESWVAPILLPERGELTAIRTPGWDLQRDESGEWRLEPEAQPTSAKMRRAKAQAWRQAVAAKVERAPPGALGAWVELRFRESDRPLHLGIIRDGGDLLLIREESDLAYRFPTAALLDPPSEEESNAGATGG